MFGSRILRQAMEEIKHSLTITEGTMQFTRHPGEWLPVVVLIRGAPVAEPLRVWLHNVDPGCAVGLQQGKIVLPTGVIDHGSVKRHVVGEDLLARDVCDQFVVDL